MSDSFDAAQLDPGEQPDFKKKKHKKEKTVPPAINSSTLCWIVVITVSYFLPECFAVLLLQPGDWMGLAFGGIWSLLLTGVALVLPKLAGRIFYGVSYYVVLAWTLAQTGYYQTFGKLMWLSDIFYADEGAVFLGDVLSSYSPLWWVGGMVLIALGVLVVRFWPVWHKRVGTYIVCAFTAGVTVTGLFLLPQALFLRDNSIWGTRSEYAQSSSYKAIYTTMYDAKSVYNICGIYQFTFRDFWVHNVYPLTPGYQQEQKNSIREVNAYFTQRGEPEDNEMTGVLEGKNVVLVLMESMDDWLITEEDTPTLCRLMDEGINFTNFYTPFYGSARTLNTEFCANTGIFLPTNGGYVFDYVTNHFNQSMASQFVDHGYSAEVFHYNEPSFYSRGVFEPVMGYNAYNSYEDYVTDEDQLFDDCFLFDSQELSDLFFREGKMFNFIITRSAHLSYVYNEVLSNYALEQYPEYRGKYGHEEVDCARVKAKLVDDMFARLLEELETRDQLENTVIIGITDHYTYGFEDTETLMELSGVEDEFMLEKTPCFIWAAGGPDLDVDKTLNTSDLLPTVLNLMGIDSAYHYLGQDAFDPGYVGYALFPDGSWISGGVVWRPEYGEEVQIISEEAPEQLPNAEKLAEISEQIRQYVRISNLLLTTDYYRTVR